MIVKRLYTFGVKLHRFATCHLMRNTRVNIRSSQSIRGEQMRWMEFRGLNKPKNYTSLRMGRIEKNGIIQII